VATLLAEQSVGGALEVAGRADVLEDGRVVAPVLLQQLRM
jgi:ABC-type branched-subunit amino acid transport system ATPase component